MDMSILLGKPDGQHVQALLRRTHLRTAREERHRAAEAHREGRSEDALHHFQRIKEAERRAVKAKTYKGRKERGGASGKHRRKGKNETAHCKPRTRRVRNLPRVSAISAANTQNHSPSFFVADLPRNKPKKRAKNLKQPRKLRKGRRKKKNTVESRLRKGIRYEKDVKIGLEKKLAFKSEKVISSVVATSPPKFMGKEIETDGTRSPAPGSPVNSGTIMAITVRFGNNADDQGPVRVPTGFQINKSRRTRL